MSEIEEIVEVERVALRLRAGGRLALLGTMARFRDVAALGWIERLDRFAIG